MTKREGNKQKTFINKGFCFLDEKLAEVGRAIPLKTIKPKLIHIVRERISNVLFSTGFIFLSFPDFCH